MIINLADDSSDSDSDGSSSRCSVPPPGGRSDFLGSLDLFLKEARKTAEVRQNSHIAFFLESSYWPSSGPHDRSQHLAMQCFVAKCMTTFGLRTQNAGSDILVTVGDSNHTKMH